MSRFVQNTDALVAWCERHGLDASEIRFEQPEVDIERTGETRYRLSRILPDGPPAGPPQWETIEVVTRDEMPPLWRDEWVES